MFVFISSACVLHIFHIITLHQWLCSQRKKKEEKNNKPEREESLRKFEPVENGLNRANYEFSLVSNATIDHVPNSIPSHFN